MIWVVWPTHLYKCKFTLWPTSCLSYDLSIDRCDLYRIVLVLTNDYSQNVILKWNPRISSTFDVTTVFVLYFEVFCFERGPQQIQHRNIWKRRHLGSTCSRIHLVAKYNYDVDAQRLRDERTGNFGKSLYIRVILIRINGQCYIQTYLLLTTKRSTCEDVWVVQVTPAP